MPSAKKSAKIPAAKSKKPALPARPVAKPAKIADVAELAAEPMPKFKPQPGCKVVVRGKTSAGYAEIASVSGAKAKLRFCTDTVLSLIHI